VHGGLLARRDLPEHVATLAQHGIAPHRPAGASTSTRSQQTVARPDCTLDEAIENIDIGGPAMVRAAAKNHDARGGAWSTRPTTPTLLAEIDAQRRRHLADAARLARGQGLRAHRALRRRRSPTDLRRARPAAGARRFPKSLPLAFEQVQDLRYGENPHQARGVLPRRHAAPGRQSPRHGSCRARNSRSTTSPTPTPPWECVKPVRDAGLRDRQARQSLRRGHCGDAPATPTRRAYRDRPDLGLRRHHRLQPPARRARPPRP
jgi:phosphoribosylaminoimidazolecarboxamide formyltransferase/IMP cyclohydrolase